MEGVKGSLVLIKFKTQEDKFIKFQGLRIISVAWYPALPSGPIASPSGASALPSESFLTYKFHFPPSSTTQFSQGFCNL